MYKNLTQSSLSEDSNDSEISTSSKQSTSSKRFLDGLNNGRAALHEFSDLKKQLKSDSSSHLLFLYNTADPHQIYYENIKNHYKRRTEENDFESVGEEGTAQIIHSPVVKRGKSVDCGNNNENNSSHVPETLQKYRKRIEGQNKNMGKIMNFKNKFEELEELKILREKNTKIMDEKNKIEIELVKVSKLAKEFEMRCREKEIEIGSLRKSLELYDQNSIKVNLELKLAKESLIGYTKEINALHKEVLEVKAKLECVEIEKFNLRQDLDNANEENRSLKETIKNIENASLAKNEQKAIKNLSNIILSKERNDNRVKALVPDNKDLESKLKVAEADRDQFKIRYYTTLETLKATDEWILGIIELIHYGNSRTAIEEFLRTQTDFEEQIKSTNQELLGFNEPSSDRSYSSPLSKTSLQSPVLSYDQELKSLTLQLLHEKEAKKELEDTLKIFQENSEKSQISNILAYLQCQASVIEECLQSEECDEIPSLYK
ncbi:unnamed protein product [Blepharisma stoltei]|uniref:Uncharacterized protein n=1 Tax=Blepharisma stoltei TaxID=1481888 RepID=A0AAU9K042_9CILI|nr:unnamed protein product [Blepharisma stoltei]